ncbi:MAG TPA: glycosyltransferase family 39 protein [Anaerolineales bacterium]
MAAAGRRTFFVSVHFFSREGIISSLQSRLLVRIAQVLVALVLCYFTAALLFVTFSRIAYPFGLEWLEGASLIQVHRILAGQPLYTRPSLDYIALLYSPLYFYLSALVAKLIGFGFLPLRLVSFLSSLGCAALIYGWVRKHTAGFYVPLMAAGSFLATYKLGGAWFDIARVDMLALCLLLCAVYLIEGRTIFHLLLAGAAMSLASLTKQTYLILALPLLVYGFSIHRARVLLVLVASLVVSGIAHLWLNATSNGWYSFFVYGLAFNQIGTMFSRGISHFVLGYWKGPILKSVPVMLLFCGLYFVLKRREYLRLLGMLALAGGMIAFSWWGIVNRGGYNNVLIPSYAILVMFSWLLIDEVLKNAAISNPARAGVLLIYGLQLLWLMYPIAEQIPTGRDLQAAQVLLQQVRSHPGDVYLPYDNYLGLYAGKKTFANYAAYGDLGLGASESAHRERDRVSAQLATAIRDQDFSWIVLDQRITLPALDRYYESSLIRYSQDELLPVTGWQWRPILSYVPRGSPSLRIQP